MIMKKKKKNLLGLKEVKDKRAAKHVLIINNHQLFNFIDAKSSTVSRDIFDVINKRKKEMKDDPFIFNSNVKPISKIVLVDDKNIYIPEFFYIIHKLQNIIIFSHG